MKLFRKSLLVVVFFSLSACGAVQAIDIYNARNVEIVQKNLIMKDIENAIITAGARRGWVMRKVSDGKMRGTLHIRRHVAEVFVTYNKEKFSIDYADSKKLHYDPKEKVIHKNYNSWVRNLENDIQVLLSSAGSSK